MSKPRRKAGYTTTKNTKEPNTSPSPNTTSTTNALITCPTCKTQFPAKYKTCPRCPNPL